MESITSRSQGTPGDPSRGVLHRMWRRCSLGLGVVGVWRQSTARVAPAPVRRDTGACAGVLSLSSQDWESTLGLRGTALKREPPIQRDEIATTVLLDWGKAAWYDLALVWRAGGRPEVV
jgi:hypothetical protein